MMGKRICVAAAFVLAQLMIWGWATSRAFSADVIVVCPPAFEQALTPWVDYRTQQGMVVEVIRPERDAEALRQQISRQSDDSTRYVLLVGDAPVFGKPCNVQRQTPIMYLPTKVTAAWGSTPTLSSDLLYGDFNQ